ncbi:Hypothetical protein A7982_00648 [Minicystis rosea]|nr:Hypothetical protein A7982_00648 [Minicystis rosea]
MPVPPLSKFTQSTAHSLDELKRIAPPSKNVLDQLGLLSELSGSWVGSGFNLIARPDKHNGKPFFLQLNATVETLDFSPIGGKVPNRGSEQDDVFLHGLHYLQRVSDAATFAALHIEPGFWLHVPPSAVPDVPENYVRQAVIPHGDSLIAQSIAFADVRSGPILDPVDAFPFVIKPGVPIPGLNKVPNPDIVTGNDYLAQFTPPALPPGLPEGLDPAEVVRDPVAILREAIRGQEITRTVVISVSSAAGQGDQGGIVNIPFIRANANAIQLDAIFWVETVRLDAENELQQLQYVQRVVLDFGGIHWPHISVATLVKQ